MKRLLLAEDNLLTRLGIEALLQTDAELSLVATTDRGEAVIPLYREHKPDAVLLDLELPGVHGIQILQQLKLIDANARVLIVSDYDTHEDVFRGLHEGALGYITKHMHGDRLIQAIHDVAEGRRHVPPEIAELYVERTQQQTLNARELQVLRGVHAGLTNKQIARSTKLSEKTIEMYVTRVLEKLNARSRTEALANAVARGLLRPNKPERR